MKDFEKQYLAQLDKIKHPENKKVAKKLINECISNSFSKSTIVSKVFYISELSNYFNKNFEDISREDLSEFISKQSERLSEGTMVGVRRHIKSFYNWFEGDNEQGIKSTKVAWVKSKPKLNELTYQDIFTYEEIIEMVKRAKTYRDKCIIMLLFDSGTRPGEFRAFKIKDININNGEGLVTLKITESKTYKREIPVCRSLEFIEAYIHTEHPDPNNPEAWLFYKSKTQKTPENEEPLDDMDLTNLLRYASEKSGIKKRIYPHLLRHSRATEVAKNKSMDESEMRYFFGWARTSNMPATYKHISSTMIKDSIKKEAGSIKKMKEFSSYKPVKCPNCEAVNPGVNVTCYKCNVPLSSEYRKVIENNDAEMDLLRGQNKLLKERLDKLERFVLSGIHLNTLRDKDTLTLSRGEESLTISGKDGVIE